MSCLLSLMQILFDRIITSDMFSVVSDMQAHTSLVITCFCMVGSFTSGEGSV